MAPDERRVHGACHAIATLGSEHEVHAIAACCENLVSGRAYKLGDVLVSMDGTEKASEFLLGVLERMGISAG